MQRQSLGSPASKLHSHIHGVPVNKEEATFSEESKRKVVQLLDPSPSSLAVALAEERKQTKPHRSSHSPIQPNKLIHLIPVLMLLCFIVLYLCSRIPSQSDLAGFSTLNLKPKHTGSTDLNEIGRLIEVQSGDVLAIRSLRNLREVEKRVPKSRQHRKFADF